MRRLWWRLTDSPVLRLRAGRKASERHDTLMLLKVFDYPQFTYVTGLWVGAVVERKFGTTPYTLRHLEVLEGDGYAFATGEGNEARYHITPKGRSALEKLTILKEAASDGMTAYQAIFNYFGLPAALLISIIALYRSCLPGNLEARIERPEQQMQQGTAPGTPNRTPTSFPHVVEVLCGPCDSVVVDAAWE